jgi:hypothetical protein
MKPVLSKALAISRLSKLQKFMLKAALCNIWNRASFRLPPYESAFTDLYYFEVATLYFQVGSYVKWALEKRMRIPARRPGGRGNRYQSTYASISRAIRRLADRGLVELNAGSNWSGINLTRQGRTVARTLVSFLF